jgi:uncharacterized OB-fold protein
VGLNAVQVPIADGIFTWPSENPRLLGSRCDDCGTHTFPAQSGCPRCGSESMATVPLAERGTLFTFTTQEYLPKEPYGGPETEDDFPGFAVGYVELAGQVIVETRLTGCVPGELRIGMAVRLVVVPFRREPDGTEVLTYAFAPVTAEGGSA